MADNASQAPSIPKPRFFETFGLGLKLVASELKWLGIEAIHRLEARQMKRRLAEEQRELGELTQKKTAQPDSAAYDREIELALKQVEFLKEEIDHLEAENRRSRQDYIAKRAKRWGLA
jgi:cell division protein FtsB